MRKRRAAVSFLFQSGTNQAELEALRTILPTREGRILVRDGHSFVDKMELIGQLIDPHGPGGCWLWQGATNAAGYGPHRTVYEVLRGRLHRGQVLHHTCRVRRCVNPDHLEPMTNLEHQRLHREQRAAS